METEPLLQLLDTEKKATVIREQARNDAEKRIQLARKEAETYAKKELEQHRLRLKEEQDLAASQLGKEVEAIRKTSTDKKDKMQKKAESGKEDAAKLVLDTIDSLAQ